MGASSSKKKKDKKDAAGGLSSGFSQLKGSFEQTTQSLAEASQKAVDDVTKTVNETSDSVRKQVETAESQVEKTTAEVTTGIKDKADAFSKSAEKTVEDVRKEAESKIQSVTAAIQKTSDDAKESVDSKVGQLKSQAEAGKAQLKGQVDATASKVNTTAENARNSLNEFSKQGAAAVKNLENQATDARRSAENKANELKGATEAKVSEIKGATEAKVSEIKGATEAKVSEVKGAVDAKTTELKNTAQKKSAELKGTADEKIAGLKGAAETKASDLRNTVNTKKNELNSNAESVKNTVEGRTTELVNTAQSKAIEITDSVNTKTSQLKSAANTKADELNKNVEQLKKEADSKSQELQKSVSQKQDEINKGKGDLENEIKGNAAGLADGLKSAVTGAVEGAVHVATDAAHKTVEGVGQSLTKATASVSNSLSGAVNQVSSSVSSVAGSAVPGLLNKVGLVGSSLAQGASSLNKMAENAIGGLVPTTTVTVCEVNDLKDGEMKVFKVSDEGSVLLVKENGEFSALGTKCSHYGAPLVKGVLHDGTVRCPWHGACFNMKTGDIEDSPGLDSIPCYQVTVEDGQVKVAAPTDLLKHNIRTKSLSNRDKADKRNFVIIGGGGAAESCAETLRQNGYTGGLVVLTKEDHLPYDRPKLSKALSSTGKELALRSEEYFRSGDIEILLNHEVTSVNVAEKTVKCSNNTVFPFDKLMIATGGTPSTLDVPGNDLGNIFYLRTPNDANNIADAARDKNVVIIGTSFIGMEVASYMNGKAKTIAVVGRSKTPFVDVFGNEVGERLKTLCTDKGVTFYTETGVSEFVGTDGKLSAVKLNNGTELPADLCVIGIGVKPSTEFLKGSGVPLNEKGLIPVDQTMKTSVQDVFGAGDIVEFPLPLFKKNKVNIGHWQMAQTHGRQAAYSMLGMEKKIQTVPFFWCALFGKNVRYAGYGAGVDDYIIDGNLQEMKFVLYACSGNDVVAVATMGMDPVASNFASYIRSGKTLSKAEVQSDPKGWISSSC